MPHRPPAARWHAWVSAVLIAGAVCATSRTAFAFEVVPRARAPRRSHAAAWLCAGAGAGLIAASFPLARAADRRYDEYLRETNPGAIPSRWDATVRADHVASGSLLAGEVLLATAAYLGFLRAPAAERVALSAGPSRCAVSLRF